MMADVALLRSLISVFPEVQLIYPTVSLCLTTGSDDDTYSPTLDQKPRIAGGPSASSSDDSLPSGGADGVDRRRYRR